MRIKLKTYTTLSKYILRDVSLGDHFPLGLASRNIIDVLQDLEILLKEEIIILVN